MGYYTFADIRDQLDHNQLEILVKPSNIVLQLTCSGETLEMWFDAKLFNTLLEKLTAAADAAEIQLVNVGFKELKP
jgi:hypothetical protein